ncbi:MAG: AAA family ATPase [Crocosphaera sp.]
MYIKKIEFTNFRGFQELSIDLPENLAVFIGWNGSGKTTILDGIYSLLKILARNIMRASQAYKYDYSVFDRDILEKKDIKILQKESKLEITVILNDNNNRLEDIDNSLRWSVIINHRASRKSSIYRIDDESSKKHISSLFSNKKKENNIGLPIIIYYPANRISFDSPSSENELIQSLESGHLRGQQLDIYHEIFMSQRSSNNNKFSFQIFVNWFENQENQENEEIITLQNFDYRNNKLEIIRKALEKFLSKLSGTNFHSLRMTRNDNPLSSSLTIKKDDTVFKLSQLSDGEKKCVLIAVDIARRLAIANPGLEVSDVLKKGKGIILIDEIEAHLHPGWQREIIPALRQTFPSCQFIVTTHSPQVLSKVKGENIFILEDGTVTNAKDAGYHTKGRTSNSILSELFDVRERPQEYKDRINNCLRLIDEGFQAKDDTKIQQAKDELSQLKNELGEDDLDIINVGTTLRFRSKLKRKN